MIFLYDVLSVWELAHRWHNHDPNLTDPKALPLEIQDTLRFLTRKMAYHDLRSCSSGGSEYTIDLDIMRFEDFIRAYRIDQTLSDAEQWSYYEDYLESMQNKTKRHNENILGLEECFQQRVYDKEKLDNLFVVQHDFAKFCRREDIDLPSFWYPKNWNIDLGGVIDKPEKLDQEEQQTTQLGAIQEDRIRCRTLAQKLWDEDPSLTIASLIRHHDIQVYGNGKLYKGRDTIRSWIKDLDPRPEDKRSGRPSKKSQPPR